MANINAKGMCIVCLRVSTDERIPYDHRRGVKMARNARRNGLSKECGRLWSGKSLRFSGRDESLRVWFLMGSHELEPPAG
jgi:hypothetical protein